jgi:hypothetical protein
MRLQVRERNESPVLGDGGCPCCDRLPRGTSASGPDRGASLRYDKSWMGATHFQMKTLKHVGTEMALHVLAYT